MTVAAVRPPAASQTLRRLQVVCNTPYSPMLGLRSRRCCHAAVALFGTRKKVDDEANGWLPAKLHRAALVAALRFCPAGSRPPRPARPARGRFPKHVHVALLMRAHQATH